MKKQYPIHPTKKQLEQLKLAWSMLQKEVTAFYAKVGQLESNVSKITKIQGLEFFQVDNDFVGIGNYDRTLKLIHKEELEKR
jgi:hypothetical protein